MLRQFGTNEFLFILAATQWTVLLSIIAFAGGAAGGLAIALMRVSPVKILSATARGFIQVFQGTPLLMQLFLAFFGANTLGFDINP